MAVSTRRVGDHGSNLKAVASDGKRPLAVVIVTYNSSSVLTGLLDSLPAGLDGVDSFEVIVVDNASQDRSADIARVHPIGPSVIETGRNAGYSAAINAANATIAAHKNILVLNPDIRLYPGAARILNDRLADPSIGIAVPQILNENGSISRSLRREPSVTTAWADAIVGSRLAARIGLSEIIDDAAVYEREGPVEWACGAILAVAARARQAVGDWDESFFLYSEEVDFQERVRRCGLSILYDARAQAVHIGGDIQDNAYLCSLMSANRIRYYRRRHGTFATALFRLGVIAGETMRLPLGQRHRAALRGAIMA